MKEQCEISINEDISKLQTNESSLKLASKRSVPGITHSWDLSKKVKVDKSPAQDKSRFMDE